MDISGIKRMSRDGVFRPDKKLGQNFLVDKNVRDKILESVPLSKKDTVLEIGPGFGTMTFPIAERCGKLYAVEKDAAICRIMSTDFRSVGNIELINADILDLDIKPLARGEASEIIVYGNIPYYITTPIIEKAIEGREFISDLYIVLQEELAHRLAAPAGSRVRGAVSCYVQYYCEPRRIFRIRKNCFYPKPQVDSCFMRLRILDAPSVRVKDEAQMFRIIRKAFSERRKMALNPLSDRRFSGLGRHEWEEAFVSCGIGLSARAESISLREYAALSDSVGGIGKEDTA